MKRDCRLWESEKRQKKTRVVKKNISKKETPVAWKKNKTHKYKRKQERFKKKRFALEDWQSFKYFVFIVMKRETMQTKKKKAKQNKLMGQAHHTTKRPSAYGGVGALKRATKLQQSDVEHWLSYQDAYTLHKPVRRTFRFA